MQDPKIWLMLSKHLSGNETPRESKVFLTWINENERNKEVFHKPKKYGNVQKQAHPQFFVLVFVPRFVQHICRLIFLMRKKKHAFQKRASPAKELNPSHQTKTDAKKNPLCSLPHRMFDIYFKHFYSFRQPLRQTTTRWCS